MAVAANDLTELRRKLESAKASFDGGRMGEAARAYRAIIDDIPDQPDALYMLGAIAYRLGKNELALQLYDETLRAAPHFAAAWSNRALILRVLERKEEALQSGRQAIACDPNLGDGWDITGLLLRETCEYEAACAHHARAAALNTRSPHVQNNYAVALAALGRLREAYDAASQAVTLDPTFAIPQLTIGNVLSEAGWSERAVIHYRKAIALDPDFTEAIASEGRTLMLMGDMAAGWAKMETRGYDKTRFAAIPRWRGEKVRHLLLYGEQGIGDIVHFLRYIPLIRDRAENITLEIPAPLHRLISANVPDIKIIASGDPLPAADAHGLLMSLPHFCGTTLDAIPAPIPYIHADDAWRVPWREKLANLPAPRIGIVWRGNPRYSNDHNRSLSRQEVEPLLAAARAHFVSLQKGSTLASDSNTDIFDTEAGLTDFAATAGLIAELDLVIAVDTGVAHLAGAMGKPVWVLLPFAPDWRWMFGREDSPWYPTMRLFRQQAPRDWTAVIDQVVTDLRRFVAGDRAVLCPSPWDGKILRRNPHAKTMPA